MYLILPTEIVYIPCTSAAVEGRVQNLELVEIAQLPLDFRGKFIISLHWVLLFVQLNWRPRKEGCR